MSEPDLSNYSAESLADPNVDAVTLGRLASTRPDLWSAILAHPNVYPDLAQWLAARVPQAPAQPEAQVQPEAVVEPEIEAEPAIGLFAVLVGSVGFGAVSGG